MTCQIWVRGSLRSPPARAIGDRFATAFPASARGVRLSPPAPKPPFEPPIVSSAPPPATVLASDSGPASPPAFADEFAFLKLQLGPTMGSPVEAAHTAADGCDVLQR